MKQSDIITTSNTALNQNLLAKKDSLLNLPLQTVGVDLAKGNDCSSLFVSAMDMMNKEQELKAKYQKEKNEIMSGWSSSIVTDSYNSYSGVMLNKDILVSFGVPIEVRAIDIGNGNKEARIVPKDGYTIEYYEDHMRNGMIYKWKRI